MLFSKIGLFKGLASTVIAFFLGFFVLIGGADAKSGMIDHVGTTAASIHHGIDELNSMLVGRNGLGPEFEHARSILQRLDSSPICAYLATKRLLNSCIISNNDRMNEHEIVQLLDNAKTVYAIRHAICQLRGAKSHIPDTCLGIERAASISTDEFELLPEKSIKECLNFLSKNHFWTSYSNSLQDASALCNTARIDYQREELLSVYRQLTTRLPNMVQIVETHISSITDLSKSFKQHLHGFLSTFEKRLQDVTVGQLQKVKHFDSALDQLHIRFNETDLALASMSIHAEEGAHMTENILAEFNKAFVATQAQSAAVISEFMAELHNNVSGSLTSVESLLQPLRSMLETDILQELPVLTQSILHSMQEAMALQYQQTQVMLDRNAILANMTELSKKAHDQVLAISEALGALSESVVPFAKSAKVLLDRVSFLGGKIVILVFGLVIIVLFPKFRTVAICLAFLLALKALQASHDFSIDIINMSQTASFKLLSLCPVFQMDSYEFMLAAAGAALGISCSVLHWANKHRYRKLSQALPLSSAPTVIQGLDNIRWTDKMLVSKKAASVGPHF